MVYWDMPDVRSQVNEPSAGWPHGELLASARPGMTYRIAAVVISTARQLFERLGLAEGDEVSCIENRRWSMQLRRADGERISLARDYAWFVQTEAVAQSHASTRGG